MPLTTESLSTTDTIAANAANSLVETTNSLHSAIGAQAAKGEAIQGEGGGHGEAAAHEGTPELENFWNLLAKSNLNKPEAPTHKIIKYFDPYVADKQQATLNQTRQNVFFGILTAILILWIFRLCIRRRAMIPNRIQSIAEMLIEGLAKFYTSILGEKHGPRYLPFLIGLFLFILFNNLMGLVPLMKSATNQFQTNIILGICVFCYVQYTGLRYLGPRNYVLHLLGSPTTGIQWALTPLMFVLHVVGELVKPISLSLRLFGNLLGEDILLGVFAAMGITIVAALLKPWGIAHPLVGLPLHLPFMFLALLTSVIQALIFSLLSCVYILLMLPHEEEHH
jgi:F-type H+-transporting ATPase subunit a